MSSSAMDEPVTPEDVSVVHIDWHRWWTMIPEIVALGCTGVFPLLIVINVLARYTNWYQVPWAQNIIHVLFLWIIFLGGALAVKYEAHVRMATLADKIFGMRGIGPAWSHVVRFSPAIMGGLLLWLGIWAVKLDMTRLLTWLQIPIGYFVTVVPLSGALMIYYTIRSFVRFRSDEQEFRQSAGGD